MRRHAIYTLLITTVLMASSTFGQELAKQKKNKTITPAATNQVVGGGTSGRLSKWSGVSGSTTYVLGDSNIFEDKFGKIGIGTTTPTSLLTVQGMIEITMGGLKFPDGTLQTTAFDSSQVVRSLNGLTGDVQLAAGANITITPAGNTLTIAASSVVAHDATLTGNGSEASPLGVALPLVLTGSNSSNPLIQVTNTGIHHAISAKGGNNDFVGGFGVVGTGGNSTGIRGGIGVAGNGGLGVSGVKGGIGVNGDGGDSDTGNGGNGVVAVGGSGNGAGKSGGFGIEATGGDGLNGATPGLAGRFNGGVQVTGTLSKGGGSFKIDHPLDPENKYLYHSFVEAPDMMNIYNGNITTDENGEAVVLLPDYFQALNRDFRYQLTVIGTFAQAIVAEKIKSNRLVIRTSSPNVEVSWQVTGIRQDAFANKNRITVEEAKPDIERGFYLHPEAFNQPEEKSIQWARDPDRMQQLKQRRLEVDQRRTRRPD
jgi:hypothetical protein